MAAHVASEVWNLGFVPQLSDRFVKAHGVGAFILTSARAWEQKLTVWNLARFHVVQMRLQLGVEINGARLSVFAQTISADVEFVLVKVDVFPTEPQRLRPAPSRISH